MIMQLKFVTKEEAHKLIDEVPGNEVLIIKYKGILGISDSGKFTKKKKSKRYIDRSSIVVLAQNNPVITLNLHKNYFNDFTDYKQENIVRTILLPKLE